MHRIRLKRPWTRLVGPHRSDKIDVPDTDPLPATEDATTVRYERRFNTPTGLEDDATVWLEISSWVADADGTILLNHRPILQIDDPSPDLPLRIEITRELQSNNFLAVELRGKQASCRLRGDVSLLIDDPNR